MVLKYDVLRIIDGVMNNREIGSIRNAILSIREQVLDLDDDKYYARLKLATRNELCCATPYYDGAEYVVIDTTYKIDSGERGAYWYE